MAELEEILYLYCNLFDRMSETFACWAEEARSEGALQIAEKLAVFSVGLKEINERSRQQTRKDDQA